MLSQIFIKSYFLSIRFFRVHGWIEEWRRFVGLWFLMKVTIVTVVTQVTVVTVVLYEQKIFLKRIDQQRCRGHVMERQFLLSRTYV